MRRKMVGASLAALALTLTSVAASSATANVKTAASSCSFSYPEWNKGTQDATGTAQGPVTDIDAGKHECFDRIVVRRVAGETWPGYDVRYVDHPATEATGCPVQFAAGTKVLRVLVHSPNYTDYGVVTTSNRLVSGETCENDGSPLRTWTNDIHTASAAINFAGYNSIAQAKWLGSYEGQSSFGLAVKGGKKSFRTFLANGNRDLVIDIAK